MTAFDPSVLDSIGISLARDGDDLLLIEVGDDDRTARRGDGTVDGARDYVSAPGPAGIFRRLRDLVSHELATRSGRMELPSPAGAEMVLTIRLGSSGASSTLELVYGDRSAGPPPDARDLVSTAVDLTDDWYGAHVAARDD